MTLTLGVLALAGVQADLAAAQLPTVPLPDVPSAPSVPDVPLPTAPAPAPTVPKAPAPVPTVPKAPAPAPTVPKVPVPKAPAPTVPKVPVPKAPAPTVPKVPVPKAPAPTVPKVPVPKAPAPTVPKVPAPRAPAPGSPAPGVGVPRVDAPGAPSVPNVGRSPSTRSGLPGVPAGGGGSSPAGRVGGAVGGAVGGVVGGALGAVAGGSAAAAAAGDGLAVFAIDPNSRRGRSLRGPAARRLRQVWNEPLRGRKLRRLRTTIDEADGCFGALSREAQRALILRAGLGGRRPASRRVIARRLGVGVPMVIRIERVALRTLAGSGSGLCGEGASGGGAAAVGMLEVVSAGGAISWGGDVQGASPGSASESGSKGGVDDSGDSGVKGITASGGVEAMLEPFADDDATEGSSDAFIILGALGLLALGAAALAMRSGAMAPVAAAKAAAVPANGNGNGERPLLFLDVDGVLALSPLSPSPPPGHVYYFGIGALYVPDRAGELVRELESHFELVWATGWEHHANQSLRPLLGLSHELPVITFGGKARFGSSEWKTKAISRYAGKRPAAWLDDNFDPSHDDWAERRKAPTLLIPVDRGSGLAEEHVETLIGWADRLHGSAEHAPAEQRPEREPAS